MVNEITLIQSLVRSNVYHFFDLGTVNSSNINSVIPVTHVAVFIDKNTKTIGGNEMKKTFEVSVGIGLAAKGNYPLVKHPELNSWVGINNKSLLVDELNQSLFTAPFDLEDGDMTILDSTFGENVLSINTKSNEQLPLKVVYASIFTMETDTDQTALISLTTLLDVEANDEDEAYEIVTKLINNDNASIEKVTFKDEIEDEVYTAQVLSINLEVDAEYIREAEEELVA